MSNETQKLILINNAQIAAYNMQLAIETAYGIAEHRGWWTDLETGERAERNDGELVALMHSELSEALEGIRKNADDEHLPQFKSVEVELADTIIRIFDYAEARGLRLAQAFYAKCKYNLDRQDHSLDARRKDGGKKI